MRPLLKPLAIVSLVTATACNSAAPATKDSASPSTSSSAKAPTSKPAGSASSKAEPKPTPRSGVPESGTPSASPSVSATASAEKPKDVPFSGALPAMPTEVKRCEGVDDAHLGDWTPTVDEIVTAAGALTEAVCIPPAIREAAIRACAAKVGKPETLISLDDLQGPSGCEEHIGTISEGGRKFVVFFGFYRSNASQFDGGSRAVELTADGPKLYLDALGKHGALCPTTGGPDLAPADKPAGWDSLAPATRDFLCKASK